MKKSQLMELLLQVEGDPEILLWNGIVGDYMDIRPKLTPITLTKLSEPAYQELCEISGYEPDNYGVHRWELNPFVPEGDQAYLWKSVLLVEAKPAGKTSYGRGGNIEY